mgnify:CR=1 FL=1
MQVQPCAAIVPDAFQYVKIDVQLRIQRFLDIVVVRSGQLAAGDEQLDQRRGGSIGINFTIPLFDRGNVAIATRRAEIAQDNARLELENLLHEVGLQVRRAVLDYEAAQEQLRVAETQLQAAELALEATQERYNVGAATLVELSQARAAHVRAASSLVSARYNLLFQRTLVDYYVGDLDPSRLAGERGGTP